MLNLRLWLLPLLLVGEFALAHQPVMDMAPRWSQGYGLQTRVEHFDSQTTTWLEGIYTFDRSVRATFKLPYTNGKIGDLILGMPLKKYHNDGARTSNWSITPSVQLPTGQEGEWDAGVSLSYSAETPSFYQLYDLYTWGDRTGLDINAGFAFPGKSRGLFALWDITALHEKRGERVHTGPVFVLFRKNMMLRAEFKAQVHKQGVSDIGNYISFGIGLVY